MICITTCTFSYTPKSVQQISTQNIQKKFIIGSILGISTVGNLIPTIANANEEKVRLEYMPALQGLDYGKVRCIK